MDYANALRDENERFADLVFKFDLATPVPTCPGWSLLELTKHLGRGHRWAAQIIRDRASTGLDPRSVPDGRPPDDIEGARSWLSASAEMVIHAIEQTGPQTGVWTFLGPRPASWWLRRRLHEATVHRADAAIATHTDHTLSVERAADGISEWLERIVEVQAQGQAPSLPDGATLALLATDANPGGETSWNVCGSSTGVRWPTDQLETVADVELVGPSSDLFLAMVRRLPLDETAIDIAGDAALWQSWLERTPL